MKERMIPSTCPYCGHVFQIKRDTMAVAGLNPTIDSRLKDGTYFTHQCSVCHRLYHIEQPFLYHHPDLKFILILSHQKNFSNLPKDEQVIRCKNAKQFLFSYRVLCENLDLKKVVSLQKQLEVKYHEKVTFDSYDASSGYLMFFVHERLVAVKYK